LEEKLRTREGLRAGDACAQEEDTTIKEKRLERPLESECPTGVHLSPFHSVWEKRLVMERVRQKKAKESWGLSISFLRPPRGMHTRHNNKKGGKVSARRKDGRSGAKKAEAMGGGLGVQILVLIKHMCQHRNVGRKRIQEQVYPRLRRGRGEDLRGGRAGSPRSKNR